MKFFNRFTEGRINRVTYITGLLLALAIDIVTLYFLIKSNIDVESLLGIGLIMGMVALSVLYGYMLEIKRHHDYGLDGWQIPEFFKGYSKFEWIYNSLKPGQLGSNKYCPQPKPGINWKSLFFLQ